MVGLAGPGPNRSLRSRLFFFQLSRRIFIWTFWRIERAAARIIAKLAVTGLPAVLLSPNRFLLSTCRSWLGLIERLCSACLIIIDYYLAERSEGRGPTLRPQGLLYSCRLSSAFGSSFLADLRPARRCPAPSASFRSRPPASLQDFKSIMCSTELLLD